MHGVYLDRDVDRIGYTGSNVHSWEIPCFSSEIEPGLSIHPQHDFARGGSFVGENLLCFDDHDEVFSSFLRIRGSLLLVV